MVVEEESRDKQGPRVDSMDGGVGGARAVGCMRAHAHPSLHPFYQVAQKWAELLAEEFMQQGDLETQLGIPTPPHMNRRLATSNSLALNTIDNFVAPTLSLLSTFLPRVRTPHRRYLCSVHGILFYIMLTLNIT